MDDAQEARGGQVGCAFPLAIASAEHRERAANLVRITKLVPAGTENCVLNDR